MGDGTMGKSATLGQPNPDGCDQLFVEVSSSYHGELRRLALRLTSNHHDAEDLVQEVLGRLFVHRHRLPYVHERRAWLYRVTYNLFITQRRRRSPGAGHQQDVSVELLGSWEPPQPSGDDLLTGPEQCAFLMQLRDFTALLVEQLSPEQRQAVSLHDLQGLSLPEIAAQLGMSVNTLKSSLTRARSLLRSGLAAYDPVSASLARRRRGRSRTTRRGHGSFRRRQQPPAESQPPA
jgi:RNA polymerase sigma-70 factor (ECF subfamily)